MTKRGISAFSVYTDPVEISYYHDWCNTSGSAAHMTEPSVACPPILNASQMCGYRAGARLLPAGVFDLGIEREGLRKLNMPAGGFVPLEAPAVCGSRNCEDAGMSDLRNTRIAGYSLLIESIPRRTTVDRRVTTHCEPRRLAASGTLNRSGVRQSTLAGTQSHRLPVPDSVRRIPPLRENQSECTQ
jgi:hypothetical protein